MINHRYNERARPRYTSTVTLPAIAAALLVVLLSVGERLSAADYFNGREIYDLHCQGCHGVDGVSLAPGTPDFSRGDGLFKTDVELFQQIRGGGSAPRGVSRLSLLVGMLTKVKGAVSYLPARIGIPEGAKLLGSIRGDRLELEK